VHFLGRIDAQLKVRGHRVEAQAVEDILQSQFREIEAAVVDYQNEALVAFVAAPSVCEETILEVAPAPAKWATHITATLAKQLPEHSVPTKIFLVEKFAMQPISGKIDRKCLTHFSRLLRNTEPKAEDVHRGTAARARNTGEGAVKVKPPDDALVVAPECQEVLAICRAVFEMPLGLDDGFVDSGGHSIAIARLAQKLHAAGWVIPVRALLSDCNTARKVASCPRALNQPAHAITALVKSEEINAEGDEAAAEVLSIGYFTTLQVLFAIVLYSPALVAFLSVFAEVGTFLTTASLWTFIIDGFFLYLLALVMPFVSLLWVMIVKFFVGGDIYKNGVIPGVYPKWSKMHLRVWCIGRLENMVLLQLRLM